MVPAVPLVVPGVPPILEAIRPLHRNGRTHQVHPQVQLQSDVTIGHQETGATHQKHKARNKRGITIEHRESDCEIFQNCWSSSQLISWMQKCLHPHSSHDSDSERPSKVASEKHTRKTRFLIDKNCEIRKRTKITIAHAEDALAEPYFVQKIVVT